MLYNVFVCVPSPIGRQFGRGGGRRGGRKGCITSISPGSCSIRISKADNWRVEFSGCNIAMSNAFFWRFGGPQAATTCGKLTETEFDNVTALSLCSNGSLPGFAAALHWRQHSATNTFLTNILLVLLHAIFEIEFRIISYW